MVDVSKGRLFSRIVVNEATGCWEYLSPLSPSGYGQFALETMGNTILTHRLMYQIMVGPLPKNLVLDHLCRNRKCCNPEHLEPVTQHENWYRGESPFAINAKKTHCKRGHEFTEENTKIVKGRIGPARQCKTCSREYQRNLRKSPYWAERYRQYAAQQRERNKAKLNAPEENRS